MSMKKLLDEIHSTIKTIIQELGFPQVDFVVEPAKPGFGDGNMCANSDEAFGPLTFPQGTYFFVVDSFYAPNNPSGRDVGPYAVTLLPVELMNFTVE